MSDIWWSFRHSPLTVAAAIVTALYFLGALFAPWVAPFDPFDLKSLNLMDAFTPPGAVHSPSATRSGCSRAWAAFDPSRSPRRKAL